MTDKNEALEALLAKAGRFLARANYPLAKSEFEKAIKLIGQDKLSGFPDLTANLTLCRQEIDLQKAKDLTKKAKRLLEKKNSAEAIRCYEQALALHYDARLAERLAALRADCCGQDAAKEASAAEVAGNFALAAQVYGEACTTQDDPALRLGQARCLVKAGDYPQAIAILAGLDHAAPAVCYDHGFALFQQGRYFAALKAWDGIRSQDERFRSQRASAQALLVADLLLRFSRSEGLADIYNEGRYLLESGDQQALPPGLAEVVEHCRYAKITELWGQGRFADIAALLMPFGPVMPPALCAVAAKTFFRLAEESSQFLPELTLFWLTALFAPQAFPPGDGDGGQGKTRQELIGRVEKLLTRLAESGDPLAQKELSAWAIDLRLIEELQRLVAGRPALAPLLCTPRFASRFGQGAEVLALIRESRPLFASDEQYFETGSPFTEAATSLYLLAAGDYEGALSALPANGQGDEFVKYASAKVNVVCGRHHIEMKRSKPWRFFTEAKTLFALAPRYEEDFCAKAKLARDPQVIEGYVNVLDQLHRLRPTATIAEALSLVMTDQAMRMGQRSNSTRKSIEAIIGKALVLNPKNELAHIALADIREAIALEDICVALSYHKLAKAFRIAQDADSDWVRENYFIAMERLVKDLDEEMQITLQERVFFLNELREWCAKMDDRHPLVTQIDAKLKSMEDGGQDR